MPLNPAGSKKKNPKLPQPYTLKPSNFKPLKPKSQEEKSKKTAPNAERPLNSGTQTAQLPKSGAGAASAHAVLAHVRVQKPRLGDHLNSASAVQGFKGSGM